MVLPIGEIAFQNNRSGNLIDHLLALFPLDIRLVQLLMGSHGGAALIPEDDRDLNLFL